MEHLPKRQLRPTASVPTTAEHYGQKYGIPDDIQAALLNVGRQGRMMVSQGRTFDRTQSFPVFGSTSTFTPEQPLSDATAMHGFTTNAEALEHAQRIIAKEEARKNELKPYSHTIPSDTLSSRYLSRSSPERGPAGGRSLQFGEDGLELEGGMEWEGSPRRSRPEPHPTLTTSKKRRPVDEGSETEGDDDDDNDEVDMVDDIPPLSYAAEGSGSTIDDFPPVFKSPQITQPELFAVSSQALPSRKLNGRTMKGMPGRNLGKTLSAPVGKLGGWRGGMDVDGDREMDGYDVSEWAASEEF